MSQHGPHDAARLHELLSRHAKYHRLRQGADDPRQLGRITCRIFVKVMPVEYARALKELEKAQETSDGMTVGVKRSA